MLACLRAPASAASPAAARTVSSVPGEKRALEFKLAKLNKKLDKAKARGESAKVVTMRACTISLPMSAIARYLRRHSSTTTIFSSSLHHNHFLLLFLFLLLLLSLSLFLLGSSMPWLG